MQYSTMNNSLANLNITYDNNMMFLSIKIDNTLSRKSHIDMIITKFSTACFAIRMVKPLISQ